MGDLGDLSTLLWEWWGFPASQGQPRPEGGSQTPPGQVWEQVHGGFSVALPRHQDSPGEQWLLPCRHWAAGPLAQEPGRSLQKQCDEHCSHPPTQQHAPSRHKCFPSWTPLPSCWARPACDLWVSFPRGTLGLSGMGLTCLLKVRGEQLRPLPQPRQ